MDLYLIYSIGLHENYFKLVDPSTWADANTQGEFEQATPVFMGNISANFWNIQSLFDFINTHNIRVVGTRTTLIC